LPLMDDSDFPAQQSMFKARVESLSSKGWDQH